MKYLCHVPTETYGFISVEIEGSAQDALLAYKELVEATRGTVGLTVGTFNRFIYEYLSTGKPGSIEVWAKMDGTQKEIVNEIKKLIKKLNK